eukprot:3838668-Amphidinium_carterae.1
MIARIAHSILISTLPTFMPVVARSQCHSVAGIAEWTSPVVVQLAAVDEHHVQVQTALSTLHH